MAGKTETGFDSQVNHQRHRAIRSKHSHRSQIIIPILVSSLGHVHPTNK